MSCCYLCGIELEMEVNSSTENHYEHIIPQALGGQLTKQGILCKICGGEKYLGGKVDKPFTDIFLFITECIDIKKDRNTNSVNLEGKLYLSDENKPIDVILNNNVITHKRPDYKIDYTNKRVYVYANKIVAKNYKIKVENDLKKQLENYSEYKIEVISELNGFPNILELPFNIENKTFELGLIKIAIEFALSEGIEYKTIEHLIDRSSRMIKCNNNIIPYYPIVEVEEILEYARLDIDSNFLSHSLVLFSQYHIDNNNNTIKQLYCFIELFGSFQYFVELNNNYVGKHIEPKTYAQRLMKFYPSDYRIKNLDYKDLLISMKELNFSKKDIYGLSCDEICIKLQSTYDRKNRYVFDYKENCKKIVESMIQNGILQQNKNIISKIFDIKDHFYEDMEDGDFNITFFRSRFIKNGDPYSIIPEIRELYCKDKDKFKIYTYFKFNALCDYIDKNKYEAKN